MFDAADIKDLNENMNMDIINVVDVEDVNLRKCRGQIKRSKEDTVGSVKTFSRVSLVLKKSSMAAFSIPSTYMTTSTLLSMTAAVSSPHSSLDFLLLSVRSGLLDALSVHGKFVAALGVDSGLLEGPDSWLA